MPDLEVRRLGRTKMKPKALGLGGGHLGWPEQSDENAIATVRGAIERGLNFFDTCGCRVLEEGSSQCLSSTNADLAELFDRA